MLMRMIFNIFVFVLAILCGTQVNAGLSVSEVVVSGNGKDKNAAIYDALINAVSQATGVAIDSNTLLKLDHSAKGGVFNNKGDYIESFNQKLKTDTQSRVKGVVKGYDVISEDRDDGQYSVALKVKVETYTTPGPSNESRRRIAVMPFEVVSIKNCNNNYNATKISNSLEEAISSQLTTSRRFMVLDRNADSSYKKEKSLILSDDTVYGERAKLGQVRGTDYILTGIIQNMTVQENIKHNPVTGAPISQGISGQLIVDFKVMVFATRQIKFSSSVSVNIDKTNELSCAEVADRLVKQAALRAVDMLIDDIFPLTIIRTNPRQQMVYLNMGGEKIARGQRFSVYSLGEELIDPYTGESLGAEEEEIGVIEIVDVKPKFSTARMVEGDFSYVREGQICRNTAK